MRSLKIDVLDQVGVGTYDIDLWRCMTTFRPPCCGSSKGSVSVVGVSALEWLGAGAPPPAANCP